MKKIYSILAILYLFTAVSCTDHTDNPLPNDRTIVFSLSLPDESHAQTRAQLVEKDYRNFTVKWNVGDVMTLFFHYNAVYYTSEGRVISVSNSGKTAQFSVQLPEEIDPKGAYRVYGVSGKNGTILNKRPQIYVGMVRSTPEDFQVPVFFSAAIARQWPKDIICSHLGAYEILHFKNKSINTVSVTFNGFNSEKPWYYVYAAYNPIDDKLFPGISNVPSSELRENTPTTKIPTESTAQFYCWYIPTGEKMQEATLVMDIDGKTIASSNTKSSDIDIQKGKAYHLYATWNGQELIQGLETYTDRLRLSASELTMPLDGEATVNILSGNGSYSVETSDSKTAVGYMSRGTVKIRSAYPGEATITVTDDFTSEKKEVKVTVVPTDDNLYGRIMQDMILVEPGTFIMGIDGPEEDFCSPAHQVTIKRPYFIGKYEVTRKLYYEVCNDEIPENIENPDWGIGQLARYEVRDFIIALNKKTKKNFRLPSNAEWEFAARGGIYSKGYTYSGSNELSDVAVMREGSSSTEYRTPVGTKRPNELGIYDMTGGMREWVDDYPYEYTSDPETSPRHIPEVDDIYQGIIRFDGEQKGCPIGYWLPYSWTGSRSDFGFRLMLPVVEDW